MRTSITALVLIAALSAAAVAADGILPNRMAKAQAGEWVILKDTAGEHAGETEKFTVIEVKDGTDGKLVTIRRERFDAEGKPLETREVEIDSADIGKRMAELEDKARIVSREKVNFDDKDYLLWSLTWDKDNDDGESNEYKVWICDDIPVGGLYKSWSSDPDFPAVEFVEAGTAKAE